MNSTFSKIFANFKPKRLTLFGMLLALYCSSLATSAVASGGYNPPYYDNEVAFWRDVMTYLNAIDASTGVGSQYLTFIYQFLYNNWSEVHSISTHTRDGFDRNHQDLSSVTNNLRYILNQDWALFTGLPLNQRNKLNDSRWLATNNLAYYFSQIWREPRMSWDWSENDPQKPYPKARPALGWSVAETLSALLSSRFRSDGDDPEIKFNSFGSYFGEPFQGQSYNQFMGGYYTFEDWAADAFRSNWSFVTVTSLSSFTNNATATSDMDQYYGTVRQETSENATNETDIVHDFNDTFADMIPDKDDIDNSLDLLDKNWDHWQPNLSNGSDELTIFPGHTMSTGFQVPEVKVHLTLPAGFSSILYGVMTFFWSVTFFWAVFNLVKTEYDYWSTLGGSA